jgi:hypothetical protein
MTYVLVNYSNHNHAIGLLDINGRYANALQVLVIKMIEYLITLIIIEISVSFARIFESIMENLQMFGANT